MVTGKDEKPQQSKSRSSQDENSAESVPPNEEEKESKRTDDAMPVKRKRGRPFDKDRLKVSTKKEKGEAQVEKTTEVLTSKRKRKSTEVYGTACFEKRKKKNYDYSTGKGVKLGDVPIIRHRIEQTDDKDLVVFYKMLYNRLPGKGTCKVDIFEFCGWPSDESFKTAFPLIKNYVINRLLPEALEWILDLLVIEREDKDWYQQRDALVEFLKEPKMNDQEVPTPIDQELPTTPIPTQVKKPKSSQKKKPNASKKKLVKSKGGDGVSDSTTENHVDNEEEDKENLKKMKTKSTPMKTEILISKSNVRSRVNESSSDESLILIKRPIDIPQKKDTNDEEDDSDDDSEDELLCKMSAFPPSDDDLGQVICALVKEADWTTVTMRTMVKQVNEIYSQFDMTPRKEFIKATIKQLVT